MAFPRYCDETSCNANSASNGLNKWLHQYVPENCVIHSFRHCLRDRLRAVECPADIVDAIGGWKTAGGAWIWRWLSIRSLREMDDEDLMCVCCTPIVMQTH